MLKSVKHWFATVSPEALMLFLGGVSLVLVAALLFFTDIAGVPAAIITAAIPVSIGLVGQFISNDRQNQREIEAKLRERKGEAYENFIKFWMDSLMLKGQREKMIRSQAQQTREINELSKSLMLWASSDVVRAYSVFRRHSLEINDQQSTKTAIDTLLLFEKMIVLMREDMGHEINGIKQFDLLSFFVNDIDRYENYELQDAA